MLADTMRMAALSVEPIQFVAFSQNALDTSALALSVPSGTAAGDLMILAFTTQSSLTITPPSGWTTIYNAHSTTPDLRTLLMYKVASSSEPASYSIGISSSRACQGGIMTYRNAQYNTYSGVSVAAGVSTLNVSLSPASAGGAVIHYSGSQNSSDLASTPITGFAELFENYSTSLNAKSNMQISHVVPVGSTSTSSVSNTWSATGGMAAALIELIPT